MSDDPLLFTPSREYLTALMLHGLRSGKVTLAVDVTDPGVVMPIEWIKRTADGAVVDPIVILDYGLNLPIPIPDLRVDLAGVLATLSFGCVPYETFVPWSAVRDMAYENPLPVLSAAELSALVADTVAAIPPPQEEKPRRLRRITQVDVFDPAQVNEYDPTVIAEVFQHHGLIAVK